jgi:hypothetical protein
MIKVEDDPGAPLQVGGRDDGDDAGSSLRPG